METTYRALYVGVLFLTVLFAGCSSVDVPSGTGGSPDDPILRRVAETRDYLDRLTGIYTYDVQGRLQKIEAHDHVSIPGSVRSYTMEFAYDNGNVSTMTQHYLSAPDESQFDHQITYHYDAQGCLTGETTRMLNSPATSSISYEYDQDGQFARWSSSSTSEPKFNIRYDEYKNVTAVWWIGPNAGDVNITKGTEEPGTIWENHYIYDSHPKPCFGIDQLPFIEPLPYFGTTATAARNLSTYNMVHGGGSSWLYTYDAAGYPAMIETRWDGIETMEPMIVKLKYIEIK